MSKNKSADDEWPEGEDLTLDDFDELDDQSGDIEFIYEGARLFRIYRCENGTFDIEMNDDITWSETAQNFWKIIAALGGTRVH